MDSREAYTILANIAPFSKLTKRRLKRLVGAGVLSEFNNDEVIYAQGSDPDFLFVLLKGRLAASTEIEGRRHDIEILKRGICFGIISLLTGQPHSVTTRSIERSDVLKIPKEFFKDFLKSEPFLSLEFSTILSQRVTSRSKPKEIFQSKKIAVIANKKEPRQKYAAQLAASLAGETGKKSIVVFCAKGLDITGGGGFCPKTNNLDDFKEPLFNTFIIGGAYDKVNVAFGLKDNFLSMLNYLSESYHFIICAMDRSLACDNHDVTIGPCDQIHLLVDSYSDDMREAGVFVKQLEEKSQINKAKIKAVVFGKHPGDNISFDRDCRRLGHSLYARIPQEDQVSYEKALKRISREIGEMTLGVALGSGAAYGFSHIGVLKVLQEAEIEIDIICGSSMGAIIGSLWAAGFSYKKIVETAYNLGRQLGRFAFTGFSFPFRGIMKARRLESIFKDAFGELTFYDLQRRLKIVAFDFKNRSAVIFDQGPLYKAIAASCAFPGFFEPVGLKNNILLDGGILHPLPTKILLEFSTHKIIASNITLSKEEAQRHYQERGPLHVFDFIFGSIETMQQEFVQEASKIADVVIHPSLEGLGWLEFDKINDFIARGEAAAKGRLQEIKRLALC
jgi:NTE family protein